MHLYCDSSLLKHLALRSRSIRPRQGFPNGRPYTTPGLGDRIQSILCAYQYGKAHNTPVTLHITDDKWSVAGGVKSDVKKHSWREIISLFPKDSVFIMPHPVENLPEDEWIRYLKKQGYDATSWWYKDTTWMHGDLDVPTDIEMSELLKEPPLLDSPDPDLRFNPTGKFVTVQWDSTDAGRSFSPIAIEQIHNHYRGLGCEIITVGGDSQDSRLKGPGCLKNVGHLMSKAEGHIGADSGFFHLAWLYLPFERIHVYTRAGGSISQHVWCGQRYGIRKYSL